MIVLPKLDNPYLNLKYNSKARWLSYWYQVHETISRGTSSILVIGKGSGIVENAITTIAPQIKIVTLDINSELLPDVVGDIRHLPFQNLSFDCILCCQVLEHIPFCELEGVLEEFSRVIRNSLIISIPHKRKHLKIEIDGPLIGHRLLIIKNPFTKKNITSRHHHWEINRGVSFKEVKKAFEKFFIMEKTFLNEINCMHRFFILRKS